MKRKSLFFIVMLFLFLGQVATLLLLLETNDILFAFLFIFFGGSSTIMLRY